MCCCYSIDIIIPGNKCIDANCPDVHEVKSFLYWVLENLFCLEKGCFGDMNFKKAPKNQVERSDITIVPGNKDIDANGPDICKVKSLLHWVLDKLILS